MFVERHVLWNRSGVDVAARCSPGIAPRPSLGWFFTDVYRSLPIFRTFLGDFTPDRLDSRSLQSLWERKNRVPRLLVTLGIILGLRALSPVYPARAPLSTLSSPLGARPGPPPRGGPGACRRGGPGRNYEPLSTLSYNRANPSPHCHYHKH